MGKMGKLTEPKTRAINKLIFEEAKSVFGLKNYHIGVEKDSEGTWVYSSSEQLLSTSIWAPTQPNDDGNCVWVFYFQKRIVSAETIRGTWFDGNCSDELSSVCEF